MSWFSKLLGYNHEELEELHDRAEEAKTKLDQARNEFHDALNELRTDPNHPLTALISALRQDRARSKEGSGRESTTTAH